MCYESHIESDLFLPFCRLPHDCCLKEQRTVLGNANLTFFLIHIVDSLLQKLDRDCTCLFYCF